MEAAASLFGATILLAGSVDSDSWSRDSAVRAFSVGVLFRFGRGSLATSESVDEAWDARFREAEGVGASGAAYNSPLPALRPLAKEGSTEVTTQDRLTRIVRHITPEKPAIEQRNQAIRERLLQRGRYLDGENFSRVHPHVLEQAFDVYDETVFDGCCRSLLREAGAPIDFRFSRRMTRTGGMTIRYEPGTSDKGSRTRYEIKLSSTLLFQSFRDGRDLIVSGCRCTNRLDAMLRIVEHEMIHLIEMLLWRDSSCARRRFQGIAYRLFEHTESTHQLLTPVEIARDQYGIRPGDAVSFAFQGRDYSGRVNRITRRATVLVLDPAGERYSDGRRYRKFYVPLAALRKAG